MVYLGRPYYFKFFKARFPQILLGSFLNTLTQICFVVRVLFFFNFFFCLKLGLTNLLLNVFLQMRFRNYIYFELPFNFNPTFTIYNCLFSSLKVVNKVFCDSFWENSVVKIVEK